MEICNTGNTGNLVDQYKVGNTIIKIYDSAYICKTKEETAQIIKRIEALGRRALIATSGSGLMNK